ncbi:ABC transporter permease [Flavobacteriaceae bacterium]|nr:ABC transporter permease [Flavobacteriaceae bacterium]MDC0637781.1 ABC transporter permease [Flavobacteriaceae bacterium]
MRFIVFIAKRYLLAHHSKHAVGLISKIAISAVAVASLALFVVLSGFSGLKTYALAFTNDFDSDLLVRPVEGKRLEFGPEQKNAVAIIPNVAQVSTIIEDRVFMQYKDKSRVAMLRGVDSLFAEVTPLDSLLYAGSWLRPKSDELVIGYEIASDLALPPRDYANLVTLYAPRPGKNISAMINPSSAFNKELAVVSGIYEINDQVNDRFLFSDQVTARALLQMAPHQISALAIKAAPNADLDQIKAELNIAFGQPISVKTRMEQNDALYKMLNSENLFTYLFISLIAAIAIFNLTGTLIMLVLEKRQNLKTLYMLGSPLKSLRQTFFVTGLLMTGLGLVIGLGLGIVIVWGQASFGWVPITPTLAYPVVLSLTNLLIVLATVTSLGALASFLGSRRITEGLLQ